MALVHRTNTEHPAEQVGWRPAAFHLRSSTCRFRMCLLRPGGWPATRSADPFRTLQLEPSTVRGTRMTDDRLAGSASNTQRGEDVAKVLRCLKPALDSSSMNSASVRSRPPGVMTSIPRSVRNTSAAGPGSARSGSLLSTDEQPGAGRNALPADSAELPPHARHPSRGQSASGCTHCRAGVHHRRSCPRRPHIDRPRGLSLSTRRARRTTSGRSYSMP